MNIPPTLSNTQMLGILPFRLALTDGDIFLSKGFYKMFCQVQEELMTQLRKMKLKRYIF